MTQDSKGSPPVQLHVIHDLGGGSAKWLRDYARADSQRTNLVLRSFTHGRAAANGIALHAGPDAEQPLKAWSFREGIVATAVTHPEYRKALEEIVREHRVEVVLASSLIGHSLDLLDTGLATLVVNHDYYPYCPAINIHFDGLCRECDDKRIAQCHAGNPRFNPFVDFLPPERIAVRRRFLELVRRPNVTMVVPTRSVQDNLTRLEPAFGTARFVTIPHGYGDPLVAKTAPEPKADDRLRIMVFGQLSEAKGLELLEAALPELTRFAEVFLVGAKEVGELFHFKPHVHVVSNYAFDELPGHVANINPHLAVLMSIVPETFSYALSEMWMLGVPVAATRVGAFAERIRDRETGFLLDPNPKTVAAAIEAIDLDRGALAKVRAHIANWKPVAASEMVEQYHRAAPVAGARAVAPEPLRVRSPDADATSEEALAAQAITVAGMWKQVRSTHLQMALINEARLRTESAMNAAAAHYARDRERLAENIEGLTHAVAERDAALVTREAAGLEQERQIAELRRELDHRMSVIEVLNARIDELYRSTSWRISRPIRGVAWGLRQAKSGLRGASWILRNPSAFPERVGKLRESWRRGGYNETKKAVVGMRQEDTGRKDLWTDYRERFERDVKPRVVEAINAMTVRPLITVIVPTFNTREDSLVQMIESVRAQLYGDWELVISDDASTEPHVRRILEKYAKEDGRINVRFNTENRGVSYTSNRALDLATGDWIVLLDHDDTLEEHALFRVAQSGFDRRGAHHARRRHGAPLRVPAGVLARVPALAPVHRPPRRIPRLAHPGDRRLRREARHFAGLRPAPAGRRAREDHRAHPRHPLPLAHPRRLIGDRQEAAGDGRFARRDPAPPRSQPRGRPGRGGRAFQPLRGALSDPAGPEGGDHHPYQEPRGAAQAMHR
jgi:glycosyltransferase involved in cell wall biosynthesis